MGTVGIVVCGEHQVILDFTASLDQWVQQAAWEEEAGLEEEAAEEQEVLTLSRPPGASLDFLVLQDLWECLDHVASVERPAISDPRASLDP